MHCRLCINCYVTRLIEGGGVASPPPLHIHKLAISLTINAKTTSIVLQVPSWSVQRKSQNLNKKRLKEIIQKAVPRLVYNEMYKSFSDRNGIIFKVQLFAVNLI